MTHKLTTKLFIFSFSHLLCVWRPPLPNIWWLPIYIPRDLPVHLSRAVRPSQTDVQYPSKKLWMAWQNTICIYWVSANSDQTLGSELKDITYIILL